MVDVVVQECGQEFGDRADSSRSPNLAHRGGWRVPGPARPLRLRQDDAASRYRRAGDGRWGESTSAGGGSTMSIPGSGISAWCSRTTPSTRISPFAEIGYNMKLRRMRPAGDEPARRRVAAMLGIDGLLDRRPAELSGGQRQRVALAARSPATARCSHGRAARAISMPRSASMSGSSSENFSGESASPPSTSPTTKSRRWCLADRIAVMANGTIEQIGTRRKCLQSPGDLVLRPFRRLPKGQRDYRFADTDRRT